MITGHKELITWGRVGEKMGKRMRGLVVWFIGPRHGIVIKLPTARSQIIFCVFDVI